MQRSSSNAICSVGQKAEAMAICESFGDYFAASFFASRKPAPLRNSVMSWDAIKDSDPPFLRRCVFGSLRARSFCCVRRPTCDVPKD